jgi:hypothetical protein
LALIKFIIIWLGFDPAMAAGIVGALDGIGTGITVSAPAYSQGKNIGILTTITMSSLYAFAGYEIEYGKAATEEQNKVVVKPSGSCPVQ